MTTQTHPQPLTHITELSPYQASMSPDEYRQRYGVTNVVQMASNENPYGMSAQAQQAIIEATRGVHRYPNNGSLQASIAQLYGITPEQVVAGSGSNDILDLVARVFLDSGDEAISSQYAFMVYAIATQTAGAKNVVVPAKDYGLDLPAMKQAITPRTKVIWLVNPNNPTGTFLPYSAIREFIAEVPRHITVVLDEAYVEYLMPDESVDTTAWLEDFPHLIIARTFSKMYGLAGLRVGYGLAAPHIIELMNRVRLPFNVNNIALAAAQAALIDQEFVAKSRILNVDNRDQLVKGLLALGVKSIPSKANFIAAEFTDMRHVYERLLERGVIIRPLAGYGMPQHARITVGTPEENERLLVQLRDILAI